MIGGLETCALLSRGSGGPVSATLSLLGSAFSVTLLARDTSLGAHLTAISKHCCPALHITATHTPKRAANCSHQLDTLTLMRVTSAIVCSKMQRCGHQSQLLARGKLCARVTQRQAYSELRKHYSDGSIAHTPQSSGPRSKIKSPYPGGPTAPS